MAFTSQWVANVPPCPKGLGGDIVGSCSSRVMDVNDGLVETDLRRSFLFRRDAVASPWLWRNVRNVVFLDFFVRSLLICKVGS